ncbi:cytochrome b-c1 complex subunit 7 isoform X1 [Mustela lutreola]|uniref:cytochrome b-c1 complex subunit 7 isoform X1 n=2 Tax=Caniformia TaxID=379584 RepID=UPI002797B3C9|nr:cytochrome b-c1 complex subunit 7 isoform X1 [Mustela lutreola]
MTGGDRSANFLSPLALLERHSGQLSQGSCEASDSCRLIWNVSSVCRFGEVCIYFAASSQWLEGIRKWYYNAAGFNKLGLMRDDTIHENDDVKEAIRRLPENLYNDRMFRIKRALDLTMRHQILPKEQWTKYEEDKFYLEPYLKEVIRERKEREEWAKK